MVWATMADTVINHNSGANEEEVPPRRQVAMDKISPGSGEFPRVWNPFDPSRYERAMIEAEKFAGFTHLCHHCSRFAPSSQEVCDMTVSDGIRPDTHHY